MTHFIIAKVRETTTLPMAAYQVSGEYLMLKSAAASGWLNEKAIVLESLVAIKRAGPDMILTYFAKQACAWLEEKRWIMQIRQISDYLILKKYLL